MIDESNSYTAQFTTWTPYDTYQSVVITASCTDSTNSYSLSVGSTFPRDWGIDPNTNQVVNPESQSIAPSTVELFVTPNEQNVVAMKDSILKNKLFIDPDWTAIWTWVGQNVKYNTAELSAENGGSAHWQFPFETLQSKTGICIDYSILLCSLYRDGVFGPNDCYVVLGTNGQGDWHAWVVVRLPVVGWYTVEPQENGNFIINLISNPFEVSGYTGHFSSTTNNLKRFSRYVSVILFEFRL